ncbi:Zinc finger protein 614 like protein [Argiope bruennichi]|uniref:Zinc finger protein 614 like protein n=1 Tax=Argiope bruennichi TaxID=94029 RepID=A0A8T0FBK9_ARGBR|nr:Zinc finger protein 614 like protein [Argiope bruennichi]
MESANPEHKSFENSNRATEETNGEEQFWHLEYFEQQSDDENETIKGDPFMNAGSINESSSEDEIIFMDSSGDLFEDDSELKYPLDMEGILGNVNTSLGFNDLNILPLDTKYVFEDSSLNHVLPATDNEVSSSSMNVPEIPSYPAALEISREIVPSNFNFNASPEVMDSIDNQNVFRNNSENLVCQKDPDYDGKYLQNVLDKTYNKPGPCDSDHNYAAKHFTNFLENASNIFGLREKMSTECENRIDPKRVHTQSSEKPYVCVTCGVRFRLETTLRGHLKIHAREKFYQCKYNSRYKILVEHLNTHTKERTFICLQCSKAFECKISFTNHAVVHSGKKSHICGRCGRGFSTRQTLVVHFRTHTGERPHVGKTCEKPFIQKISLTSHKKQYDEKIIFVCAVCGKKYLRKDYFDKHCRKPEDQPSER